MLRTLDSTQIGMKSAKNSHDVPLALPGNARSSVNTPDRDPRVLYHNRRARSCAVTVMPVLVICTSREGLGAGSDDPSPLPSLKHMVIDPLWERKENCRLR